MPCPGSRETNSEQVLLFAPQCTSQTGRLALSWFGKAGPYYHAISRGIDYRRVCPDRIRKSVGAETTFPRDLVELDEMRAELQPILDKVWRWCESTGIRGRTVTLKVKYADFRRITRSRSLLHEVASRDLLEQVSLELLKPLTPSEQGVRLLGVMLSALGSPEIGQVPQLSLPLQGGCGHPLGGRFRSGKSCTAEP